MIAANGETKDKKVGVRMKLTLDPNRVLFMVGREWVPITAGEATTILERHLFGFPMKV